jgi:hypothetical protein
MFLTWKTVADRVQHVQAQYVGLGKREVKSGAIGSQGLTQ